MSDQDVFPLEWQYVAEGGENCYTSVFTKKMVLLFWDLQGIMPFAAPSDSLAALGGDNAPSPTRGEYMRKQFQVNSEVFELTSNRRRLDVFGQELAERAFESLAGGEPEGGVLNDEVNDLEEAMAALRRKRLPRAPGGPGEG